MRENAVSLQDKSHKPQTYPAADRKFHKEFHLKPLHGTGIFYTNGNRFSRIRRKLEGKAGQLRSKMNDIKHISNLSNLPLYYRQSGSWLEN
jgi:hypothetical protein